jgi:hypothetical protein
MHGEKLVPGPAVVDQAERHGVRAGFIEPPWAGTQPAEGRMELPPIVGEHGQPEQHVPRLCRLGERMRLARQAGQPVAEDPVEALDMHRRRLGDRFADRGLAFDRPQPAMRVAVLDRLRQGRVRLAPAAVAGAGTRSAPAGDRCG